MKLWECDKDKVIVDESGNEWKWEKFDWMNTESIPITNLYYWVDIEKMNFSYKEKPKKLYAFKKMSDGEIVWFEVSEEPYSYTKRTPEYDIECKD